MKKVYYCLFFLLLLVLPFIVKASDDCDIKSVEIKSVELLETKGLVEEVKKPSFNDLNINLDLKFYNVGSSAKYKIVLYNNTDEKIDVSKGKLLLDNEYVSYELSTLTDSILLRREGEVYLKVKYKKAIDNSMKTDGVFNHLDNLDVSLLFTDLEKTSFNTLYIVIIVGILLGIGASIYIVSLYRKTKIKDKLLEKDSVIFLALISLIIPLTVHATCNLNLSVKSNVTIDDKNAIFVTGDEFNIKMKQLINPNIKTSTSYDASIVAIKHSSTKPKDENMKEANLVSSRESECPIYIWYDYGTIYWWSEDLTPRLNENSANMFRYLTALSNISGLKYFDASEARDLSYMFAYTYSMESFENLKDWDTSKVENLTSTFNRTYQNFKFNRSPYKY